MSKLNQTGTIRTANTDSNTFVYNPILTNGDGATRFLPSRI